jgi:hypothetical protein
MRGLTGDSKATSRAGVLDTAPAHRRGRLVATIVLIMLAIMIVRDIVVRRWTASPTAPPDVTRPR